MECTKKEEPSLTSRVSIVIPTYLRHDKLDECLRAIYEFTDNVDVIVVANGAGLECREVCGRYPVKLIWFDEPLGYPKACNHGIRASDSEYVVLLNDDAQLLPQPKNRWIDTLLKPMLADGAVGVTGPLMTRDENSNHEFLIFFCVMVRRQCFNEVGLLDEGFKYFGEDTAFCIEAERKGWKVVRVPEEHPTTLVPLDPSTTTLETWKHDKVHSGQFDIWHDAESTIGRLEGCDEVLRESRARLKELYGSPDDINIHRAMVTDGWIAHDELIWLARRAKARGPNATIIQIGAWHGKSSRAISDNMGEGSQLIDVDSFNGSSGEPDQHATAKERQGDHCFQWYWDNQYELIMQGRVIPMRMQSVNAAHTLAHRGIKADMIFIDGDHSAEGIKTDVEAWLPLLKEGGVICGHDYYKESEGPWWVFVRQYVEAKFPGVQKAATSIWWTVPSNPHREVITKLFTDTDRISTILDIGCGDGESVRTLRDMGFANVVGIDIASESPDVAQGDMHALEFADNSFDIVFSSHSLEHAHDPLQALSEFCRVLKPDGQLYLVLPYLDVLDSEHRARVHCGSEALGLTMDDGGATVRRVVESAGFTTTYGELGNIREREMYLKCKPRKVQGYRRINTSSRL